MTAGNNKHDGRDEHDEHAGCGGHDPHAAPGDDGYGYDYDDGYGCDGDDGLLAAIVGAGPPPGADAAALAAHRAAEADVALLGERLKAIGDALATAPGPRRAPRPEPAPGPGLQPPGGRRRGRRFAVGAVAVAVAGCALSGTAWLLAHAPGGGAASQAGGASDKSVTAPVAPFGDPAYLACARQVVAGEVTAVARTADGAWRVSLTVTRSYKPAGAEGREVGFLLDRGAVPRDVRRGDVLLVGMPADGSAAGYAAVGAAAVAREGAAAAGALPRAAGMSCAR
ncbi:hypothetical protein AB0465_08060 [Streptomyces griseoviridis]|uniref:hypothetical protein n=1 Tax=Streptomyces griseoviridis TaxID=45398 RepID=UPI00344C33F5